MKQERPYPRLSVSRKAEHSIESGHPWVYDTEVAPPESAPADGVLCDITGEKGNYLGTGFYNSHSKIRIRLLSRNANDRFDEAFWERRVRYAWDYRRTVMGSDRSSCRVIFGEADQLPGLTVDRFGDVLVAQTLCLGMERVKPVLFPILRRVLAEDATVRGIYERNDVAIRKLEGMEEGKGWFESEGGPTNTVITENGISYAVDFENGQKTGFFLDQKYNRQAVARIAAGRRVLDCFTHTGSFALNAAYGGAAHVTAVDISEAAVSLAGENAKRNGLDSKVEFVASNVFDMLPKVERGKYDFIILDPPAFTKSRKTITAAQRGYKEINLRAMRLLPRGGFLATCSCSHFMDSERFIKMLGEAARDAQVQLRQIEARQQSPDHPILWNVPETDYLKFYLFQVI